MKIIVWIIQVLLAVAFLMAGGSKLIISYEDLLMDPQMQWVSAFSPEIIKIIASLEVLGAIGLIAPMILGIKRNLVPIAALCLGLDQLMALILHISRSEIGALPYNIAFIVMALITFWGRKDLFKSE